MRSSFAITLATIFVSAATGLTISSRQDPAAASHPYCSSVQEGDPCNVNNFPCCVDGFNFAECDFINGMKWFVGFCNGGCAAISGASVECILQ